MDNPLGILPSGLESLSIDKRERNGKSGELGQDTFLELMVAQLENQDPLNPLESGDFLGQLAQFATVTGIGELQDSVSTLAGSLQSNQALQASTMVGREVLIAAPTAALPPNGSISGAIDLTADAAELNLVVADTSGQVVRRLALGGQQAGLVNFTWDGVNDAGERAAPGVYMLQAEGVVNGQTQAYDSLVRAQVESVTLQKDGSGPQLNLAGLGTVAMDQVRQVM